MYATDGILHLANAIDSLPTLHSGHFSNLKIENENIRVWVSRVNGEIEVEKKTGGRWERVEWYEVN
jgi:hypothetical protein